MKYVTLQEHLNKEFQQPVNEILMTLVAGSILAYMCTPLLNTDFAKAVGGGLGAMFSGLGAIFGSFGKDKSAKDVQKGLESKDKKTMDGVGDMSQKLLGTAKVAAGDDEKGNAAINDFASVLFDEEGKMKELPLDEETQKALQETAKKHGIKPQSKEEFEKTAKETTEQIQKNPKILDDINNATRDIKVTKVENDFKKKEEELDKKLEEAKTAEEKEALKKKKEDLETKKTAAVEKVKNKPITKSEFSEEEIKSLEPGTTAAAEEVDVDGKKIKVTVFTGPRGGKYYFPDGKPKTPENKVYVDK